MLSLSMSLKPTKYCWSSFGQASVKLSKRIKYALKTVFQIFSQNTFASKMFTSDIHVSPLKAEVKSKSATGEQLSTLWATWQYYLADYASVATNHFITVYTFPIAHPCQEFWIGFGEVKWKYLEMLLTHPFPFQLWMLFPSQPKLLNRQMWQLVDDKINFHFHVVTLSPAMLVFSRNLIMRSEIFVPQMWLLNDYTKYQNYFFHGWLALEIEKNDCSHRIVLSPLFTFSYPPPLLESMICLCICLLCCEEKIVSI